MLERIRLYVTAIIVVIKTDDIVFTQILTALNLDDHQRDLARILQTVVLADGDKGGLVDIDHLLHLSAGHQSGAGHDDPVFAAMMMLLQREALPGQYFDTLDLVTAAFIKHQI